MVGRDAVLKKKIVLLISLLLLSVLTFSLFVQAESERVFDGALYLSAAEEQGIANAIADAERQTGCSFYFATYTETKVHFAGGRDELGELFLKENGLSDRDDIVILTVYRDDGTYYYDVFTYGNAYPRINDKEIDYILDHPTVYDNIKGGRLFDGVQSFFAMSAKAYDGRVGASYFIIGTVALLIGGLIGGIACFGVWKSYKRKKRPIEYPLDRYAKMELREHSDVFTGSFVTRRVIQSSSGGGGGGGGGGGHRGGR